MPSRTFALVAGDTPPAQDALRRLEARHGHSSPEKADVIVALGGDGFMLETLHKYLGSGKAIYGMNRGTVGFLLNEYKEDGLVERVERAERATLHPLAMTGRTVKGEAISALAFNEVSVLRETRQAAQICVLVDGKVRLDTLVCDGILVSTPAGSTAYNLSAHGPILPLGANLMALTPISAFRPRRWRGALVPETAKVELHVLDAAKRPVSAVADSQEFRDVVQVSVAQDRARSIDVLFDPEHDLEERILLEQFQP